MNLATTRSIRLILAAILLTLLSVTSARASFLLPGYDFAITGPPGSRSGSDRGNAAPDGDTAAWFLNSSSSYSAGNRGMAFSGFDSEFDPQNSGPGGSSAAPFAVHSLPAGHSDFVPASRTYSLGVPNGSFVPRVYSWSNGAHWNRRGDGDFFNHPNWPLDRGGSTGSLVQNVSLNAPQHPSPAVNIGPQGGNGPDGSHLGGNGSYWRGSPGDDQPLSFGGRLYPATSDPDHAGGQIYRWDDGDWRWRNFPWRPEHIVVCRPTREEGEWWHKRAPDECPEFYIPDRDCDHYHPRRCHHPHCGGHHCRYPHWSGEDHCHTVPVPSNLMLSSIGLGCFFLVRTLRGGFRRRLAD
jgi:hypothetical protein